MKLKLMFAARQAATTLGDSVDGLLPCARSGLGRGGNVPETFSQTIAGSPNVTGVIHNRSTASYFILFVFRSCGPEQDANIAFWINFSASK